MKYEGYMVGPALRKLRTDRGLSILQASNLTGLSTSSLNQIEQGGRNLSCLSSNLSTTFKSASTDK